MKFSSIIGAFGAILTGVAALGEKGVEYISENPEVLSTVGAAAGAPWAGPAILGVVAILEVAKPGQRKRAQTDDDDEPVQ